MKTFIVEVEWSGYSRGDSVYIVEAETEEEAKDLYFEGTLVEKRTIRDDTEGEVLSVKEKE